MKKPFFHIFQVIVLLVIDPLDSENTLYLNWLPKWLPSIVMVKRKDARNFVEINGLSWQNHNYLHKLNGKADQYRGL